MNSVQILHTTPGNEYFDLFMQLPHLLYKQDSDRLKQTDDVDEPYLQDCVVAIKQGKPVGRLAVYQNPALYYHNKRAICIGKYECTTDTEVANLLFAEAKKIATACHATFIVGPMDGSTWNKYRFSENNDYPNFFSEPYHHIYYNWQFINAGFKPIAKYCSSIDRKLNDVTKFHHELGDIFNRMNITFRNLDPDNLDVELNKIWKLCSCEFQDNFLCTPIAAEHFLKKYKSMGKWLNPGLVILSEDNGELVGCIFCLDDICNTQEKTLIIKTVVRNRNEKYKGLGQVMIGMIYQKVAEEGYAAILHAFMIEGNTSAYISKQYEGKIHKRYTLYGLSL